MSRKITTLCSPNGTSAAGTLAIERNTFNEVINFAKAAAPNEVCGFLLVRQLKPDAYLVIDNSLHIPYQRVSAGYSETLPEGEVEQMDVEEAYEDDPAVFRLLWHSHGGGAAHFSVTDTNTHQRMATTTALDAMFFMVVNTNGQASANLEVYRPFRIGTQVRLVVLENDTEPDMEPYKEQLRIKCAPMPKSNSVSAYLYDGDEMDD